MIGVWVSVRAARIENAYWVLISNTPPCEVCQDTWGVFQGFVGQLMVLAEGWDSDMPVPEAHYPKQTTNPTLAAAAGCRRHTAVLDVW